jgi:hypothetical protein
VTVENCCKLRHQFSDSALPQEYSAQAVNKEERGEVRFGLSPEPARTGSSRMPVGLSGPQIVDKLAEFRHDQDALRVSVNNRRRIIQLSVLLVYSPTRQIPQEYVRRAPNRQFRRQRSHPTRPKPGSVDDDFCPSSDDLRQKGA